MKTTELKKGFQDGKYEELLRDIYIDESVLDYQKERYIKAIESFEELFGEKEVEIYSAPGRSEIGGNHTDHQLGRVLAASINSKERRRGNFRRAHSWCCCKVKRRRL